MQEDADITIRTAWAIGLFEGEGCITVSDTGNRRFPRVAMTLTTTDLDVIQRFAEIVGIGTVANKRFRKEKPHWKPQWTWSVYGEKALTLMKSWEPHLGERRSGRAKEVTAIHSNAHIERQHAPRNCKECGVTFSPDKYNHQRFCSSRCRERMKQRNLRKKWKAEGKVRTATGYALPVQGHIPGTRPDTSRITRHTLTSTRTTS